jgi:hypothetical protein
VASCTGQQETLHETSSRTPSMQSNVHTDPLGVAGQEQSVYNARLAKKHGACCRYAKFVHSPEMLAAA